MRALAMEMWAFARKDPRKPVFAAKVAVALALITLLVVLREPREIASHSVWAILTVAVVFELYVAAPLPCDVSSLAFPKPFVVAVVVAVNSKSRCMTLSHIKFPPRRK